MVEFVDFKIEIPNETIFKEITMTFSLPVVFSFLFLTIIEILVPGHFFQLFMFFIVIGLFCFFVGRLYITKASFNWIDPHVFIFEGRTLIRHHYSKIKPREVDLSSVYKLKFWNRNYKKRLEIDHIESNGEKTRDNIFASPFEKCETEWQRLFEEIKKRVPEDTEIIIK